MHVIRCEGCGISEPEDEASGEASGADIRPVELKIAGLDPREWAQQRDQTVLKADLCGSCRRGCGIAYFGQERKPGSLDVPVFLRAVAGGAR